MSRTGAKTLGGIAFLILISLGVGPLVQWWVFDHASGPIAVLFAHPGEPWVWIWPVLVGAVALIVALCCGVIADRVDGPGSDGT